MHQGALILLLCVAVTVMVWGVQIMRGAIDSWFPIKTIMHLFCKYLDDTIIQ